MAYNDFMSRTDATANLSVELGSEIVAGAARVSAALNLGEQVPMTVLTNIIPSEASLPVAYWNVPDGTPTSLAQTSKMTLAGNTITAYEIDALCAIPQNVLDDAQAYDLDLWPMVQRRMGEAMAKKLDQGAIWGTGAPAGSNLSVMAYIAACSGGRLATVNTNSTTTVTDPAASSADVGKQVWGPGIPASATIASVSAGVSFTLSAAATATATGVGLLILPANPAYVVEAPVFTAGHDSAADLLSAANAVAMCGYGITAAFVSPGWPYRNMAARTQQLVSNPVGNDAIPLNMAGIPVAPCGNSRAGTAGGGVGPVWSPLADMIVGDWSSLKIGVRQDVTFTKHTEGVISDSNGVVQYNLMQAGGVAFKATARWSWIVIPELVSDDSFVGQRSTFASVLNNGAAGRVGGPLLEDPRPEIPATVPLPPTNQPAPADVISRGDVKQERTRKR